MRESHFFVFIIIFCFHHQLLQLWRTFGDFCLGSFILHIAHRRKGTPSGPQSDSVTEMGLACRSLDYVPLLFLPLAHL